MEIQWLGLIIPLAYFLVSTFFLLFPNIIHSRAKYKSQIFNDLIQSNRIMCIGHRGGSWEGPQNTIQLLKQTQKLVDMYQIDVCLTMDNKLVVHHDQDLIRSCNQFVKLNQINYRQLPRLQKQILAMGDRQVKTSQNQIPLLQDVFRMFPTMPMNIQLITFSEEAAQQFNRLVKQYHRQDITIWGVVDSNNSRLRQINSDILNFYSAGQVLSIYFLFLIGLLPFVCLRQGVLDIPLATDSLYDLIMRMTTYHKCRRYLWIFVYYILKCFNFFSKLFVPHLKKRGILTFFFILNQQEDFESAINIGCSGIMTDLPTKLSQHLKRNKLYPKQQNNQLFSDQEIRSL